MALDRALGTRVVIECPRGLVALFEVVAGAQRVIAKGNPLPEFDWHLRLLSLPHRLGATLASIPARGPYRRPPPDRRTPLPPARGNHPAALRVGLAWRGHPQHKNDGRCSLSFAAGTAVHRDGRGVLQSASGAHGGIHG